MFERFTDRARKIMALANQEAQNAGYEYIDPGHILLGLIREGTGVGVNVLKNLGVDLHDVRREILDELKPINQDETVGRLPQSAGAKLVIQYAIEEARNINHNYVGSEHILLGLFRVRDSIPARVLAQHQVRVEQARDEVLNLLGAGKEGRHSNASSGDTLSPKEPTITEASADTLIYSLLIRFDKQIAQLMSEKESAVRDADYNKAARDRDATLIFSECKCEIIRCLLNSQIPDHLKPSTDPFNQFMIRRELIAQLIETCPTLHTGFTDVVERLRKPPTL